MLAFVFLMFFKLVSAEPIELRGLHSAQPLEAKILQAIQEERLWVASGQQREKLERLRSSGFVCKKHPRNLYVCKKRITEKLPEEIARLAHELVEKRYAHHQLEFADEQPTSQLIHESPAFSRWEVSQEVRINDQVFPEYFWFEGPNVKKLELRSEQGLAHSFVVKSGGFDILFSTQVKNHRLLIKVPLRK